MQNMMFTDKISIEIKLAKEIESKLKDLKSFLSDTYHR